MSNNFSKANIKVEVKTKEGVNVLIQQNITEDEVERQKTITKKIETPVAVVEKERKSSKERKPLVFVETPSEAENQSLELGKKRDERKNDDRKFLKDYRSTAKDTEAEHDTYKRSTSSDVGSMSEFEGCGEDIIIDIRSSTYSETNSAKFEQHVRVQLMRSRLSAAASKSDFAIGDNSSSKFTRQQIPESDFKFDGTENPIPLGKFDDLETINNKKCREEESNEPENDFDSSAS